MPLITDWIMVIITAAYVIATILICIYNGKSADATRKQVEESQRQFEETKRLNMMPYLEVTLHNDITDITDFPDGIHLVLNSRSSENWATIDRRIQIKNIGLGVAKNFRYI